MDELIDKLCKKDVWLFCVKITDFTDKMFNIFKDIYKSNNKESQFMISKLENVEDLSRKIVEKCKEVYKKGRFNYGNDNFKKNIS